MPRTTMYAIWSFRQSQWWKPRSQGYTMDPEQVGFYSEKDAGAIALHGLPGANIPVDETLFRQMADATPKGVEVRLDELRRI